jgi:hypothetical protein
MAIEKYLDRVTSEHRDKPKFIQWLTSTLTKTDGIYNCLSVMDDAFDLDKAVGKQQDVLGELIGVSRTLNFQPTPDISPLLNDDTYRLIQKAKIGKNNWLGTEPEIQTIWQGMFSDLRLDLIDNQDMSMTAVIYGVLDELRELLIANGYIVPKPSGVRLNFIGKSPVDFKVYSSMVVCQNITSVVSMENPKYPISQKTYSSMIVCQDITNVIS